MNNIVPCPCLTALSTPFIFNTVDFQNSANTVYNFTTSYNNTPANSNSGKKYQFKSDYERMQHKIGTFALDSNT